MKTTKEENADTLHRAKEDERRVVAKMIELAAELRIYQDYIKTYGGK